MFYVSVAAAAIDPEAYAWLVFTRATKMRLSGYNQRHVLTLSKGDVFGVRRTRSNTYQIVKSDALHVLYRNVPPNTHDRILTNSIPYKGEPITQQEVEDGFVRQRRVPTREPVRKSNKRVDDFFVPSTKRIVEKFQIDQNNYQWRKLTKSNIRVVTKKQGKSKVVLHAGSIVGLRYRSPGRGGYVLLDGNVRIHISHEMYSELVHSSRVLPESQQRTEVVDLGSGLSDEQIKKLSEPKPRKAAAPVEEAEEEVIPKLYDLDDLSEEEILDIKRERQSKHKRNLRRMVRKLLEVQNQDVWVDDDSEFEDENAPKKLKEDEDLEDVDASPKAPADDIEHPEDEDEDEDDEDIDAEDLDEDMDEEDEDDEDMGDASFRADEHVADLLEPGAMFKMKKGGGRKLVVIEAAPMERNENLMEYILHDPESDESDDDFNLFRLRLNVNMTLAKFEESAELLEETFGEDELKTIQDTVEYADVKSVSLVK